MKEQFVTYEIALFLKQKGFDELCFAGYLCKIPTLFSEIEHTLEGNLHRNSEGTFCCAPLWQQVIDWLETKGKFISILYAAPDTNKFMYRLDDYALTLYATSLISGETRRSGNFGQHSKEWFDTRTQCQTAAILKAIELI